MQCRGDTDPSASTTQFAGSRPTLVSVRSSGNAAPLAGPALATSVGAISRLFYIPTPRRRVHGRRSKAATDARALLSERDGPYPNRIALAAGSVLRRGSPPTAAPAAGAEPSTDQRVRPTPPADAAHDRTARYGGCSSVRQRTRDKPRRECWRGTHAFQDRYLAADAPADRHSAGRRTADRCRSDPVDGVRPDQFPQHRRRRGDGRGGYAAEKVPRKGGRRQCHSRVRPSDGEVPTADDALWRRDPGVCRTRPRPRLPGPNHPLCLRRRGIARREAEHPRRLPECRDQQHHLPLVLRGARRRLQRPDEMEARAAANPASRMSPRISGASSSAPREVRVPRSVQHLELLHAVALLQVARCVRDESLAQPASHQDRGRAAGLDQQQRPGGADHRQDRPIWSRCGTDQEEIRERQPRSCSSRSRRRCRTIFSSPPASATRPSGRSSTRSGRIRPPAARAPICRNPRSPRPPRKPASAVREHDRQAGRQTTSTRGTRGTATTAKRPTWRERRWRSCARTRVSGRPRWS